MSLRKHSSTLLLVPALGTMLPSACQKCETCSYSYAVGQGTMENDTFPEVCGNKNDREAQERACQTAATLAGTTCTCNKQ